VLAILFAIIFLIPVLVGEMNSSIFREQSAHNPDVCSWLHSEREQRSAEYYQMAAGYDYQTAEYARSLFEYNREFPHSPSYTNQIQQMYKELQQMYNELTNLEAQVNTLAEQYSSQCVT
jgi:hypothetical protein